MSANVGFLLIVVVISAVGSLFLWWRNRKPTSFMSSVDEFQDEMRALGRDAGQSPAPARRGSRPRGAAPAPSRKDPPPAPRRRSRGAGGDDQDGGR